MLFVSSWFRYVPLLAPMLDVPVVLLAPASGLIAGAATGFLLANRAADLAPFTDRAFHFALLAIAVAAPVAVWAWQRSRERILLAAIVLAFFAGGTSLASDAWQRAWRPSLKVVFEELADMEREDAAATSRVLPEDPSVVATITGVLRSDATLRESTVSLSVDVLTLDGDRPLSLDRAAAPVLCVRQVRGGVLLSVAGQLHADRIGEWRSGRTIRAPVILQRPSRYMNPGGQDDERALARRGSVLVGTVKSGALVEVVARGSLWAESMARGRAMVRMAVNGAVGRWSLQAAAIVNAIVIGDRAGLSPEVQRTLQEAGTYHVIAISGGNIAILAALALAGFRLAGVLGPAAMLVAIGVLGSYASLVGGGASVNRATLMAIAYFAARAIDLRSPPFNALCLVAMLLVAVDPLAVADPAFLLTCGATAAILATGSFNWRLGRHRALAPVAMLLTASLAAELALLPVGAVVFSRVTFAGLLLNFAAIPLMAVVQLAGMLVVPLWWMPGNGVWVGWIAYAAAEGLVHSGELVHYMPILVWRVAPPHRAVVASYYSALAAWAVALRRRRLRAGAGVLLIAAALWIVLQPWTLWHARGDGRLHVTFIDVGQGDAAVVTFPHGYTMLVDAGGTSSRAAFDVGDRVVAPVLRRAGIRQLDSIALSHGDADHIGGAQAIVAEFEPADVWEGIPVPPFEPLQQLRREAEGGRARWVNVQAGDAVAIEGVEVYIRHPGLPDWERQDVRNDDSIVIELRFGQASIVLTGDIGREVEQTIAPLFMPSALRVLKVPHHGSLSSSSSEFLRTLAPRVAVVSAGRSNNFGHPAPAVLERYKQSGTEIFRTDRDGAVTVVTDGHSLDVETYTGQRRRYHEDTMARRR